NRLEPAEVAALPELLNAQSLGSVLWRAVRWRAGLAHFGDVIARVEKLQASTRCLAANEGTLQFVATAANAAPWGTSAIGDWEVLGGLPDLAARGGEGGRPHHRRRSAGPAAGRRSGAR